MDAKHGSNCGTVLLSWPCFPHVLARSWDCSCNMYQDVPVKIGAAVWLLPSNTCSVTSPAALSSTNKPGDAESTLQPVVQHATGMSPCTWGRNKKTWSWQQSPKSVGGVKILMMMFIDVDSETYMNTYEWTCDRWKLKETPGWNYSSLVSHGSTPESQVRSINVEVGCQSHKGQTHHEAWSGTYKDLQVGYLGQIPSAKSLNNTF